MTRSPETAKLKSELRRHLLQARQSLPNRRDLSDQIQKIVAEMEFYQTAGTVLFYVDVRSEVTTRSLIKTHLESERVTVVPFCDGEHLQLVQLNSFDELSTGAYGILEPSSLIRHREDRRVDPETIELALIPGLGFDRKGGRLGHGKGYYDRLLPQLSPDCPRVGLAYECQLVETIPVEQHDHPLDAIVTEKGIWHVSSRFRNRL